MSKKSNQKKKVGLKLTSGQTYMLEDIEIFLHIQKTYATIMRGQLSDNDKDTCSKVMTAVNHAIQNIYTAPSGDYED